MITESPSGTERDGTSMVVLEPASTWITRVSDLELTILALPTILTTELKSTLPVIIEKPIPGTTEPLSTKTTSPLVCSVSTDSATTYSSRMTCCLPTDYLKSKTLQSFWDWKTNNSERLDSTCLTSANTSTLPELISFPDTNPSDMAYK